MKNNIDLSKIGPFITSTFQRFHITIFIVVIVLGLSYAVLSLNGLISLASDVTGQTGNGVTQITTDQATIDRIKELHTSSEAPSSIKLPSGRINPFSE